MAEKWQQVAGISGILFVILFVVGFGISGDVPMFDEGGDKINAWFADNSTQYLVGDYITGLGFIIFYFPFLIGLYTRLRMLEGDPPLMSRVALMGGILFPVAGLVAGISGASLALTEGRLSAETAELASAIGYHALASAIGASAILAGAAATVAWKAGGAWKAVAALGAIVAALAIIGSASSIEKDPEGILSALGFIALIGLGIWVLAVSASMIASGRSQQAVSMQPGAATA